MAEVAGRQGAEEGVRGEMGGGNRRLDVAA